MLRKKITFRAGETLVEVLIALMIVAMGATAGANLIVGAVQANSYNKDTLQALALAQEGVEFMRNLRDSNWLKYSSDAESCWDMVPAAAACLPGNSLAAGNYALGDTLNYDTTHTLIALPTALDLEASPSAPANATYQLKYYDVDITHDDNGNGVNDDDKDYMSSYLQIADPLQEAQLSTLPKFYRMVQISGKSATSMQITSLVEWKDGTVIHKIKLSTELTNYK